MRITKQQKLPTSAEQTTRTLNIIQFILIMGIISATVVVLGTDILKGAINLGNSLEPIIIVSVVTGLAGSFILPPILRSVPPGTQPTDEELYGKFQTSMVVKYALLEGPAFTALFLNKDKSLLGLLVIILMLVALIWSTVTVNQIKEYIQYIRELDDFQE